MIILYRPYSLIKKLILSTQHIINKILKYYCISKKVYATPIFLIFFILSGLVFFTLNLDKTDEYVFMTHTFEIQKYTAS